MLRTYASTGSGPGMSSSAGKSCLVTDVKTVRSSASPASSVSRSGRQPHQAGQPSSRSASTAGGAARDLVRPQLAVDADRPGRLAPSTLSSGLVPVAESRGVQPRLERLLVPPPGDHEPRGPLVGRLEQLEPLEPLLVIDRARRAANRRASSSPPSAGTVIALIFTTVMVCYPLLSPENRTTQDDASAHMTHLLIAWLAPRPATPSGPRAAPTPGVVCRAVADIRAVPGPVKRKPDLVTGQVQYDAFRRTNT
jgi:hypothetical protein